MAVIRDNDNYKAIGKLPINQVPSLLLSKCKQLLRQLDKPADLSPIKVLTATGIFSGYINLSLILICRILL